MRHLLFLLAVLPLATPARAQASGQVAPAAIGWYKVENLYDTIDSPDTDDAEWLPTAPKNWTGERYRIKLAHLARVIGEMGQKIHPDGLACIGLCEIENATVLEDLVHTPPIAARGYRYVHHDGPDRRGVDVAFLYDPKRFHLLNHTTHPLHDPQDSLFRTREQLVVTGVMDGDTISCIMAHWPSRRGGEKRSLPKRALAAQLGRHLVDSLLALNKDARIIYMGDLNDDPVDPSVRRFFGSTDDKTRVSNATFFNPMQPLYEKGIGSLAWQDSWNLFDQFMLSPALVTSKKGYQYYGVRVFNEPYLAQKEGNFKGYPFRIYVGDTFTNGFSDHFPVFIILAKQVPKP